MIKAVLFDLDGTLVNSIYDLADCVNFALKGAGLKERKLNEFYYFVGDGMPVMVKRALPDNDKSEETFNKVYSEFIKKYSVSFADKTVAYDGVKDLVKSLKECGIKTAVVTNKAQDMAEKVVKKCYGDLFDIILGKNDFIPLKPDPKGAMYVMEKLNVEPFECIFIGDSANDVKTGVNAKAVSVGELWGYREREELIDAKADYIIEKPEELVSIIRKING